MELLRYKDNQGLVFWASDKYINNNGPGYDHDWMVAPFWKNLNDKLTNLMDPIKKREYLPLKTTKFYKTQWKTAKFDITENDILLELYFVTMKFKCIKEIIYQSNPESLNPMTSYCPENINIKYTQNITIPKDIDTQDFWISPDYDPYDIDEGEEYLDVADDVNI